MIDPTDLVYFRNRIGEEGVELIFQSSVQIHGKAAEEKEVSVDTTVQTKAITYLTDAKLPNRNLERCWAIAQKEDIKLRQSYKRVIKQQMKWQNNTQHPRRRKQASKSLRKIKTITGRLVRDLVRKLPEGHLAYYAPQLALFQQVMNQKRGDKNKIYSLHEPDVACIAKGKAHPKYEFGSKVAIAQTKNSGIIVAAHNFKGNPHDSQTLLPTLLQYHRILGQLPEVALTDRGFRGPKAVIGVQILKPDKPKKDSSAYQKRKARTRFRRRAAIEPTIGHLKNQYRLKRNWLKGSQGDQMNLLLAAVAFNFKKWMNCLEKYSHFLSLIFFNQLFPQLYPSQRAGV